MLTPPSIVFLLALDRPLSCLSLLLEDCRRSAFSLLYLRVVPQHVSDGSSLLCARLPLVFLSLSFASCPPVAVTVRPRASPLGSSATRRCCVQMSLCPQVP